MKNAPQPDPETIIGDSLFEKTLQLEIHDQLERANQLESTLRTGKDLYQFMYDFAPIPMFDLDCSEVKVYLDKI